MAVQNSSYFLNPIYVVMRSANPNYRLSDFPLYVLDSGIFAIAGSVREYRFLDDGGLRITCMSSFQANILMNVTWLNGTIQVRVEEYPN